VFITDIERGINVSISTMTTRTTDKTRLRRTVASVDVSANGTPLRSMTWIDANNAATLLLGLVFDETGKLSERPRVQTPLGFSPRGLHPLPNVRQVFHNDGSSRRDAVQYRFAQYVVAIASESLFASREAAKVLFGGLRAVRLKFPFEAETPFADFAPAFLAVQTPVGSDGRACHAQVNAEGRTIVCESHIVKFQNDVQGEATLTVHQVGSGNAIADKCHSVGRNRKGYLLTPCDSGKVGKSCPPVHRERVAVVTGWAERGLRTANFAPFLVQCDCRLDGFRCLLPRLNVQVRNKFRAECFAVSVSKFVKGVGVPLFKSPAFSTDKIERLRKLTHRFQQAFGLFRCGFQGQSHRSVHASIMPYVCTFLQA